MGSDSLTSIFCVLLYLLAISSSTHSLRSSRMVRAEDAGKLFFVSSTRGNDAWSGLLAAPNESRTDGPFQTLRKAQTAMRLSSTKHVSLRAGTYTVSSGLSFTWSDDGEDWRAYLGETVILDGTGSGVLTFTGVKNASLESLEFRHMGAETMVFNGARSITIRANHFSACNLECINGSALTNSVIDSNTFSGQYPGNPPGNTSTAYSAVRLGYGSSDNQITHNLIENCQGGGIAFATGPKDPPNSHNIIDQNLIRNVDTKVFDMGAIYIYDASHVATGNRITSNIITGNGGSDYAKNQTKSFYIDVGTSNVLVSGNACRACGTFAWQIHAGDHNTIVNNVFDLSSAGTLLGLYQSDPRWQSHGMVNNLLTQNIVYLGGSVPAALFQVNISASDSLPVSQNNLYYSPKGLVIPNAAPVIDARPVFANPELVWRGGGNASAETSSRAYSLIGFQPLSHDQGPELPSLRPLR